MKHIHTFESFLNEAKSIDLKLSTNEYPSGTVARFRIESDSINLRKVVNLAKESWSKTAKAFTDNEIGFESAGDRKAAMTAIQKSFDSGKNDVREFLTESNVNEGDMTKNYDGFIVLDFKTQKLYKGRYIKGVNNTKAEDAVIAKAMKMTGSPRANFGVHDFVRKGQWNNNDAEILESNESFLNEAKLKDNSYQAVLFGKSKSGKWTIIKSTDPKTSLQTKDDLYPRGSNAKYTEYCIISGLGGNRGQSLQSDAEAHLAQLISGEINRATASEPFSKVEFI